MGNVIDQLNQKTCILGLVSAAFVSGAVSNYKRIKKTNNKIEWMSETKEYTPQECIDELDQRITKKVNQEDRQYSELADSEIIAKKMLISGIVNCDQPLSSKIDPSKSDFIYRYNFCIVKYSNENLQRLFNAGRIARKTPKTFSAFYVPEFHLADPLNPDKKLEVWVHLEPKTCQSSLNHYSERYTDRQLNLYERFRSKLSSILNIIGLFFQKEKSFTFSKGIEIGFNEHELGIRTGGTLAIIGDTKQLKMINPLTIIGNKLKYIERLIHRKKEKQFYFFAFTVLSCGALYFFAKEFNKIQRGGRMLANQKQDSLKNVKQALVKKVNDMKCDICNENNKQIIYKPCGHLVNCKECHQKSQSNECVICKGVIQESVEIYLS